MAPAPKRRAISSDQPTSPALGGAHTTRHPGRACVVTSVQWTTLATWRAPRIRAAKAFGPGGTVAGEPLAFVLIAAGGGVELMRSAAGGGAVLVFSITGAGAAIGEALGLSASHMVHEVHRWHAQASTATAWRLATGRASGAWLLATPPEDDRKRRIRRAREAASKWPPLHRIWDTWGR
eukprot:434961-Prymnesium_polylepis.2